MKQGKHPSDNPDQPVLNADELARTMATQGGAYGGVNHQEGGEPEAIERLDPASQAAAGQAGGSAAGAGQAGEAAGSDEAARPDAAAADGAAPSPGVTPQAAEAAELGRS